MKKKPTRHGGKLISGPIQYYLCGLCRTAEDSDKRGFGLWHYGNAGYSNILQHLMAKKHGGDIVKEYIARQRAGAVDDGLKQGKLVDPASFVFVNTVAKNIYGWADLMSNKLAWPVYWCEDDTVLRYMSPTKVCALFSSIYRRSLTNASQVDQATLLGWFDEINADTHARFAKFMKHQSGAVRPCGLMFDIWDDGKGHKYIAVFIVYDNEEFMLNKDDPGELRMGMFLLCLTPLLDPATSTGDAQIATITEALKSVGLTWETFYSLSQTTLVSFPQLLEAVIWT